jgi:hypothetical protein
MRRAFALTLAVLLAVLLACPAALLSGCDKSDEQVIREGLGSELDMLKDPDSQAVRAIVDGLGTSGVDAAQFTKSWFEGYSYSIDKVEVAEGAAKVKLRVTVKQLGPVIDAAYAELQRLTSESFASGGAEMSPEDAQQLFAEELNRQIRAARPTTTSVEIAYQRTGSEWRCVSALTSAFGPALVGYSEYL